MSVRALKHRVFAHIEELPGAREFPDRYLDQGRAVAMGKGAAQRHGVVLPGLSRPHGFGAKAFAEGDKVRD